MGIFTGLNHIRNKLDNAIANHYQRKINRQMFVIRRMACSMATFFPWYRELETHVNTFLKGDLSKNELNRIIKTYEFRFGTQFEVVLKELRKAALTGWEESEVADRKSQDKEEQDSMKRFNLAKQFIYESEVYFEKLSKLVLSIQVVVNQDKEKKLISLLKNYLAELSLYEQFCQKYIRKGLCEGIPHA